MSDFPQLNTGAIMQYPAARRTNFLTAVTRFVDGSEQRFRQFPKPVTFWVIQLHLLAQNELERLQKFYIDNQGSAGSFRFVDPWDSSVYPDCSFVEETFTWQLAEESRAQTVMTIRNNGAHL